MLTGIFWPVTPMVAVPFTDAGASVVVLSCGAYPLTAIALGPLPTEGSLAGTRLGPGTLVVAAAVLADGATVIELNVAVWVWAGRLPRVRVTLGVPAN